METKQNMVCHIASGDSACYKLEQIDLKDRSWLGQISRSPEEGDKHFSIVFSPILPLKRKQTVESATVLRETSRVTAINIWIWTIDAGQGKISESELGVIAISQC